MLGSKMDVVGREAHLARQNVVGPLANLELARGALRLTRFIEGHHQNGRAVALHEPRLLDEGLLTFFQADGVDDGFPLPDT